MAEFNLNLGARMVNGNDGAKSSNEVSSLPGAPPSLAAFRAGEKSPAGMRTFPVLSLA